MASLAVPERDAIPTPAEIEEVPAVRLFVERAATPAFALTPANAVAVAAICRRLDGLPLAIELAAAQVEGALADGTVGAAREAVATVNQRAGGAPQPGGGRCRMRSPGATTCSPPAEQVLFRRLSVFAGGFTLDAAEAVGGAALRGALRSGGAAARGLRGEGRGDRRRHRSFFSPSFPLERSDPPPAPRVPRPPREASPSVLDLVASLVDKSLLRPVAQPNSGVGSRFEMLETIREYGLERLTESGEADAVRHAHASHFLALTEAAKPGVTGPDQGRWLARLVEEHDNLRAALAWVRDHGENELWLRLAGALWRFWELRFHLREGRSWLEGALAADRGAPPAVRARALNGRRQPHVVTRRPGARRRLPGRGARLVPSGRGSPGNRLGPERPRQHRGRTRRLCHAPSRCTKRAWPCPARSAPTGRAACALHNLGLMADHWDDYDRAADLFDEALAIWERLGDEVARARSLDAAATGGTATGRSRPRPRPGRPESGAPPTLRRPERRRGLARQSGMDDAGAGRGTAGGGILFRGAAPPTGGRKPAGAGWLLDGTGQTVRGPRATGRGGPAPGHRGQPGPRRRRGATPRPPTPPRTVGGRCCRRDDRRGLRRRLGSRDGRCRCSRPSPRPPPSPTRSPEMRAALPSISARGVPSAKRGLPVSSRDSCRLAQCESPAAGRRHLSLTTHERKDVCRAEFPSAGSRS